MNRTKPAESESSQETPPPSYLLLELPVGNTFLLPPEVNVTWTASPYCLSANITPRLPWGGGGGPDLSAAKNSCLMLAGPQPPQPSASAQAGPPGPGVQPPSPSFYTWNSNHVAICDKFLLGSCQALDMCEMHHTPLPFHWQLYSVLEQRWVDINHHAQLLLERMYCNVNRENITFSEGRTVFILNLKDMKITETYKYESARRLRNSESRLQNPHFPCQWRFYWWDNVKWMEYNKAVSALLLGTMISKEVECTFKIGPREHKVDFITMTESSAASGYSTAVRCRPVYRSPDSLFPQLKTWAPMDPIQLPFHANFNVDPLEDFSTWYPPVWRLSLEDECRLIDVPADTKAYNAVRDFFYSSLPETKVDIVGIEQVQNIFHWDKYQRQKLHMEKKYAGSVEPLERHLFHGTNQKSAENIFHNNLDPRVAGINGKVLGYGAYFAKSAKLSHNYTNEWLPYRLRHMFLAKVLVGKMAMGEPGYRRPPPCNSGTSFYDSCVDFVPDPNIFVVFDSCQCYPYYLIKYRDLNCVIEI
ncbi:protein mono-ADP-ribosyltransferase TIPARP-like [Vanacampus margaritifer]